jgi:hypothetical protein
VDTVWVIVWPVLAAAALGGCRFGFDANPRMDAATSSGASDGRDASTTDDGSIPDTPSADSAPLTCPGSYIALDTSSSRYRSIDTSMTWLQSQQACESDGHHLVVLETSSELALVATTLSTQNIWTGVTDRKTVGTFLRVTGGAATYLPWDSSEPDLAGLECTFIDGLTLKLGDQDCGSGRRAVCECDGLPVDPTTY